MGFPDRIERTIELAHPVERVWAAISTAEGLAAWFGDRAEIDLRPGGHARLEWTAVDAQAELRIEHVDAPHVLAWTWRIEGLPPDDLRRTLVEFTLVPTPTGTRLTVVESGFAQLGPEEHAAAHGGNVEGWRRELGELVTYLDAR
ncbi:SRPBCC domain-containing protein [Actinomycetospora sp. CA-084318]|uniref:SRPBCC domain-containing protein n=1 Tax=Actinomycetospora sp. CA-084318 TaxID=3239892 RepID=UPI003D973666